MAQEKMSKREGKKEEQKMELNVEERTVPQMRKLHVETIDRFGALMKAKVNAVIPCLDSEGNPLSEPYKETLFGNRFILIEAGKVPKEFFEKTVSIVQSLYSKSYANKMLTFSITLHDDKTQTWKVSMSGYGSPGKATAIKEKLKTIEIEFVGFADVTFNQDLIPINDDDDFLDKKTIFIRFLQEATNQIKSDFSESKLPQFLDGFGFNRPEIEENIIKIKKIIMDAEIKKQHEEYNQNRSSPGIGLMDFFVDIFFTYKKFDFMSYLNSPNFGWKFNVYDFSKTEELKKYFHEVCEQNSGDNCDLLDTLKKDNRELLEMSKVDYFTPEKIYGIDRCQSLFAKFDKEDIYVSCDALFETLFLNSNVYILAKRLAHCSEDAMLSYMQTNKDFFLQENNFTYLFSLPVENPCNGEIKHRCDNCCAHLNKDILEHIYSSNEIGFVSEPVICTMNLPEPISPRSRKFYHGHNYIVGQQDGILKLAMNDKGFENFLYFHASNLRRYAAEGMVEKVRGEIVRFGLRLINDQNSSSKRTALHYAVKLDIPDEQVKIVLLLLEHGADPTIKDKEEKTAMNIFFDNRHRLEDYSKVQQAMENAYLKFYLNKAQKKQLNKSLFYQFSQNGELNLSEVPFPIVAEHPISVNVNDTNSSDSISDDDMKDLSMTHSRNETTSAHSSNWYNDEQIKFLLKHYIGEHPSVAYMDSMLTDNNWDSDALQNKLALYHLKYIVSRQEKDEFIKNKVIIPVNLGSTHWVLVYAIYSEDKEELPKIYYFDPKDGMGKLSRRLENFLLSKEIFAENEIIISAGQRTYNDEENATPWIIEAARAIADNKAIPEQGHNIDRARSEYATILTAGPSVPRSSTPPPQGQASSSSSPSSSSNSSFGTIPPTSSNLCASFTPPPLPKKDSDGGSNVQLEQKEEKSLSLS